MGVESRPPVLWTLALPTSDETTVIEARAEGLLPMSNILVAMQFVSAGCALAAAFCWWRASSAYVPANPRDDGYAGITMDGAITLMVGKKRAKLFETLQLQSDWNARGAIAAALAAVLQVPPMITGAFPDCVPCHEIIDGSRSRPERLT